MRSTPRSEVHPDALLGGAAESFRVALVAADLRALPELRAFVRAACAALGADAAACDALVLAADEVCTNVVQHGYAGRGGPLCLEVARAGDADGASIAVTITDGAPAFDPTRLPPPATGAPATERALGGLGWHLVRSSVDAVRYARVEDHNVVTLVRRLAPAAVPSPDA